MQGSTRRVLGDLLAAAESVTDEDVTRRGSSDGGEQNAFGQSLGDGELLFFKAKGPGHAAASGVQEGDLGAGTLK